MFARSVSIDFRHYVYDARELAKHQFQPNTVCVAGPASCSNGFAGFEGENDDGKACCPLECGQCGGADCDTAAAAAGLDATDCCVTDVINTHVACWIASRPPCEIVAGEVYPR